MKLSFILSVSLGGLRVVTALKHREPRDTCPSGYAVCAPSGATTTTVPKIGDAEMQDLFDDLVGSSLPDGSKAVVDPVHDVQGSSPSLCCVSSLTCLTMSRLLIPFCYDRYTSNYFLPDGSYGTVVDGTYQTTSGDVVNLISGDYRLENGVRGNIYSSNESAKPNTATLRLPVQFTSQGIGSAIPPSALGAVVTVVYTTIFPGITVLPSTVRESTVSARIVSGSVRPATTQISTIAGSTQVSTEMTLTETVLVAGSDVVTTVSKSTLFITLADSTVIGVVQATSDPSSTISALTIAATTIRGTTLEAFTSTLTTTIPAEQSTGIASVGATAASTTQSSASSLQPLWIVEILLIILIASSWC